MMMSELLGGPIPMFEYDRQNWWPGGMKQVERTWSIVWLRRRLSITFSGKEHS